MFTQKQLLDFIDTNFNQSYAFKKIENPLPEKERVHESEYQLYDLNYYEDELHLIESVHTPTEMTIELGGEILLTRKYIRHASM